MLDAKSFGVTPKQACINGINFFSFEKEKAPIFVRVFFYAGSKYDEKEGVAHFLEHMLGAGSQKFPSKDLLAAHIEDAGGKFAFTTNSDFICIDLEIAEPHDLPILIEVLDQMVNHSLFKAETFEKERGSILAELDEKKTHQKSFLWEVYQKLFFQKTALAKSTIGSEASIRSVTTDDVKDFMSKHITNPESDIEVVMAGGLKTEKVSEDIARLFSNRNPATKNTEKVPISRESWFGTEVFPSRTTSIRFGFRTETSTIQDEACAEICAEYIAGGRPSHLIAKLRYEKGLVYNITAINDFLQNGSSFTVQTNCSIDNLEQVLVIINAAFDHMAENGISPEKLKSTKIKLAKRALIEMQTSKSWVQNNERLVIANDGKNILDFLVAVESVSQKDIAVYTRKNFITDKKYLAACGPSSMVDIFKKVGVGV